MKKVSTKTSKNKSQPKDKNNDNDNDKTSSSNNLKTIQKVFVPSSVPEGVGARVRRIIGDSQLSQLDPFIVLDHFSVKLPGGFPDHPHRGFETVTYMLEGEVLHEDFKGNKGKLGPGDLQWMTAGKGIVHAEMAASWEKESVGFQLWINLASKHKLCKPQYQEIPKDKVLVAKKDGVTVKVIAGEALETKGPIFARTPALYLDVEMEPKSSFEQVIPKGWNAMSYVYVGQAFYGEKKKEVNEFEAVVLKRDENEILVIETKESPVKLLVIAGQPLDEKVAQQGPFVMNSEAQLVKAFDDFKAGQNGFENAPGWASEISKLSRSKSSKF